MLANSSQSMQIVGAGLVVEVWQSSIIFYGISVLLSYLERHFVRGRLLLLGMVWDYGNGNEQRSRAFDCSFVVKGRFRWVRLIWPRAGWQRLWRQNSGNMYGISVAPSGMVLRHGLQDMIAKRSLLFSRYYSTDSFSLVCNHVAKSTLHVLRDYSWVYGIWRNFV